MTQKEIITYIKEHPELSTVKLSNALNVPTPTIAEYIIKHRLRINPKKKHLSYEEYQGVRKALRKGTKEVVIAQMYDVSVSTVKRIRDKTHKWDMFDEGAVKETAQPKEQKKDLEYITNLVNQLKQKELEVEAIKAELKELFSDFKEVFSMLQDETC